MASAKFIAALALGVVVSFTSGSVTRYAHAAELWFEPIPANSDIRTLTLYGQIVEGDADRVVSALRESISEGYYIDVINLFSPGGDAGEGIELGRVINRYFLVTQAPDSDYDGKKFVCPGYPGSFEQPFDSARDFNCVCASACAIAWLGGIQRHGVPGFHRVYSDYARITHRDAREMRRVFGQQIDGYLKEVGAPGFVEDLIEWSGPEELSYPDPAQLEKLQWNVDFFNTGYAACQAFNMPLAHKNYLFQLREKAQGEELSAEEQRHLSDLEGAFQRETDCLENLRRRELANAQAELTD